MSEMIYTDFAELAGEWPKIREGAGKIVFTNGCFDLLHAGHVSYLDEARALGDFLVLGLNSDASVARLKGPKRPLNPQIDRARVLKALRAIDLVVGFEEDTPLELIKNIRPHVLVKGGDWEVSQIVGGKEVLSWGGDVRSLSFKAGVSTTDLVSLVLERYGKA